MVTKGFFNEKEMFSDEWNTLSVLLDESVISAQFAKQASIAEHLRNFGVGIYSQRNQAKAMSRIEGRKKGFRAITDLLAFRVKANTQAEITRYLEQLEAMAKEQGAAMFLKPLYKGNPDIVRFAYIYFPNENAAVEIQVGHEFSFITFAIDSLLAVYPDMKNFRTCMWTNDFYSDMVKAILKGETEKDLKAAFLAIINGKEEEIEGNEIRATVLSIIEGIKHVGLKEKDT